MAKETLQALIDRVIGKEGILRVPAYWMRRLFNEVVDFVDYSIKNVKVDVDVEMSDTSTNAVQNKIIKEYVDKKMDTINEEILNNEEITATALTTLNEKITEIAKRLDDAGV